MRSITQAADVTNPLRVCWSTETLETRQGTNQISSDCQLKMQINK